VEASESLNGYGEDAVNNQGVIGLSVRCVKCGYDLRGLSIAGKCPECGSLITRTIPKCPRCFQQGKGSVALRGEPTTMSGVWSCSACAGLGLDAGELRRMLGPGRGIPPVQEPRLAEVEAGRPVVCGHCDHPATAIRIGETVTIDRCQACGFVWLDAGELPAVVEFVHRLARGWSLPEDVEALLTSPGELAKRIALQPRTGAAGLAIAEIIGAILAGLFGC
jgi:Zn-finger nucleic acid-binding protein